MKRIIPTLLVVLLFSCSFSACKEDNPTTTDPRLDLVGTYDITIQTDSIRNNGVWFSNAALPAANQVSTKTGTLTITTADDADMINITSQIVYVGETLTYYSTTARVDPDGTIHPNPSTFTSPISGRLYNFTYRPFANGSPLVFRVEASSTANGASLVELSTNTCVKH